MQGTSGEGAALVLTLTQRQLQDKQRSAGLDMFVYNLMADELIDERIDERSDGMGRRRRMLNDED